jgi:hypothetical protein
MNSYELCKLIRRAIVNSAAEVIAYGSWGDDFCTRQVRGIVDRVKRIDWFSPVDLKDLTSAEMDDLGFGVWSDENPMRLIPLWLLPFLTDEIECECINGEKSVLKKVDMDNDARFGCIAYGVTPAS